MWATIAAMAVQITRTQIATEMAAAISAIVSSFTLMNSSSLGLVAAFPAVQPEGGRHRLCTSHAEGHSDRVDRHAVSQAAPSDRSAATLAGEGRPTPLTTIVCKTGGDVTRRAAPIPRPTGELLKCQDN